MSSTALPTTLERRYQRYFATRTPVSFRVRTVAGTVHEFGPGPSPSFTIVARTTAGERALQSLDRLQVAVAYMNGDLDVEGDLLAALDMRRFFGDFHPIAFLGRWLPVLIRGFEGHDRQSISSHYDLDTEFFFTFLDSRHHCYTQGIFASDDEPLEDAMTRKMAFAFEALALTPGDTVLDVGAGWGAFAEYAARRGVTVTAVTLAAESQKFLAELFERQQIPASVVLAHFLRYPTDVKYDAIVAMGVTEHLPDYRATLSQYARLLKPGGRVYLDALAMRRPRFVSTFLKRFIYPGNSSPLLLHSYLREVNRSPFEVLQLLDDRHNYYLTCREWDRRLEEARDHIVSRWGEALYRRFRLFLCGSAAGFRSGHIQAYRWVIQLPADAHRDVAMVRPDRQGPATAHARR
jgi:cyclopropane-fatty-acyl-phospholipid synthase